MTCADLDADRIARRSVPPSTLSLLAWRVWRSEVAFADEFVAAAGDRSDDGRPIPLVSARSDGSARPGW